MSLTIAVKADALTPDLRAKLRTARHPQPVWLAVMTQIVSITKRSFTDPGMRIAPWPNKKAAKILDGHITIVDGGPSRLIQKGAMLSSIRVVETNDQGGSVGSDRVQAAIHQVGGVIRPKSARSLVFTLSGIVMRRKKVTMPPRPFFPFLPDGTLAPQYVEKVRRITLLAMAVRLGIA